MPTVALLAAALFALAPASIAYADGDPASDYLLANQVFVTSSSGSLTPAQRQLVKVVAATNRAGFTIRVAVIAGTFDLGSLPELWRHPQLYAHFLGQELTLGYKQRLLVVMPNGFGFNWPGHANAPIDTLLSRVPIGAGRPGLAAAAQSAVRQLAAAADITPGVSNASPPAAGGAPAGLIVVAVLCASTALAIVFARTRRRRPAVATPRTVVTSRGALPLKVHFAIVAAVIVFAIAIAVIVVVVTRGSSKPSLTIPTASVSSAQAKSVVTPPPYSWAPGRRPAPGFSLHDQAGGPVKLAAYRGHPLILTFLDPVCRNVCPLQAKVLNQAVAQMPEAQRPSVVAVSVDVYADSRADLLKDVRKWDLLPEWRWAVGSPAQLAAVWKDYKIEVAVTHEQVGGETVASITHTAATYIIDSTGHERALFLWPFYPQDVEHILRALSAGARSRV